MGLNTDDVYPAYRRIYFGPPKWRGAHTDLIIAVSCGGNTDGVWPATIAVALCGGGGDKKRKFGGGAIASFWPAQVAYVVNFQNAVTWISKTKAAAFGGAFQNDYYRLRT